MNFEDFYGACFAFGGGELLQIIYLFFIYAGLNFDEIGHLFSCADIDVYIFYVSY